MENEAADVFATGALTVATTPAATVMELPLEAVRVSDPLVKV
jgi:hypothetical protein